MIMNEYPNYMIFSNGAILSLKRKKFLKPYTNTFGYKCVDLFKNGKRKALKVHRLVAIHFIPKIDNKNEVDHINRNKCDNRKINLRWVDRSENMLNTSTYKNNLLNEKNISYDRTWKKYRFRKYKNKKIAISKWFDTLNEAIDFKNNYLNNNINV